METINYENLIVNDNTISSGSFGKIYKCEYMGNIYAYKEFESSSFLCNRKRKLENISNIKEDFLITPYYWIKKDGEKLGYLTKLLNGKDIISIQFLGIDYKIDIINKIKNQIQLMHKYELIHADISSSNIILENDIPYIIDFDNSSYNKYYTNIYDSSDMAQEFIRKYGICKELDIFMFNLLTFELINNCNYNLIRKNIILKNFGNFDNIDSKDICETFFLDDSLPNKKFLIDTIK